MFEENDFNVLYYIKRNGYTNQREISSKLNISLGSVNKHLQCLQKSKYIDDKYQITDKGINKLNYYKVDNAIIMAAGMSSRFAPLSYEKPKGLLLVKNEILIERQIKQLQEVGINDITIVVGYMKEKFFYLEEKFKVRLISNEDYYKYNNPSTLLLVLDKLKNTYICSSDDYFVENVFEPYVYRAYYAATFTKEKCNEYGLVINNDNRIVSVDFNPENMWIMMGHVYFDKQFSNIFKKILVDEYDKNNTKYELWEKLLSRNLDKLNIYIRKYSDGIIYEFDSLEELREFDPKYLTNANSKIFDNICKILKCKEEEITDIQVIKNGLTNLSFRFKCKNQNYIYRNPGIGTENYINRQSEAFSTKIAKELGLDKTVIYIDPKEGWKISYYIDNVRELDYHNKSEVKNALKMIKRLHNEKIKSKYDFNIWSKCNDLLNKVSTITESITDFEDIYKTMNKVYEYASKDNVPKILCHCDCYQPNFLIDEDNNMTLIDWEYSGNDDPANDLGTFICCSDYNYEEALDILKIYYGHKPTDFELKHSLAYIAISSYYWYLWAIYQESLGKVIGEYLYIWYKNTIFYMKKAIELYEVNNEEK